MVYMVGRRTRQSLIILCVLFYVVLECFCYAAAGGRKETVLERRRVSPIHRARLEQGLLLFHTWLQSQRSASGWLKSWDSSNQIVAEFVQHLYDNAYRPSHAKYALLGIQEQWKYLRHHLERPWAALTVWQREVGTKNRIPISLEFVQAFFGVAISWGLEDKEAAAIMFPLAILVRLAFECCLRVGEVLALHVKDVQLPRIGSMMKVGVIAILKPKNKGALGLQQFTTFTSEMTIAWVRWFVRDLPRNVKLWPTTPYNFRKAFHSVMNRMECGELGLLPAGLRAGGCTHLHLIEGMEIPTLRYKVRHKSETSLASYVQEAVAAMTMLSLSESQELHLMSLVEGSSCVWLSPPACAWQELYSRWRQLLALQRTKPFLSRHSRRIL